jgi:hypothetical protein
MEFRYEDPTSNAARYFIAKCIEIPPEKLTVSQLVKTRAFCSAGIFVKIVLNIVQSLFLAHSLLPACRSDTNMQQAANKYCTLISMLTTTRRLSP